MDLDQKISALALEFSGVMGVAAINLTTEERLLHQADGSFPPASTIKIPLLYALFAGALEHRWSMDDRLTLTVDHLAEGSGVLLDLTPGLMLTIGDIATLMIVVSDNTATNMLIDLVGTERVNRAMDELGFPGLRLNRKIGIDSAVPLGTATPLEMAELMALIARRRVLTPRACTELLEIMSKQRFKELTSRFIRETDSESEQPRVRIASKSGWVRGIRNEVAVVWTPRSQYVLSMFSRDCKDRRFYHDNEGSIALARVSEAVYEAWGR